MKKLLSLVLTLAILLGVSVPYGVVDCISNNEVAKLTLNYTSLTLYNHQTKKLKVKAPRGFKVEKVDFSGNNKKFLRTYSSGKLEARANKDLVANKAKAKVITTVKYEKKVNGKWKTITKKLNCNVTIAYCDHKGKYKEKKTEATCTSGTRHDFTCTVCGHKYTKWDNDAKGHSYDKDGKWIRKATCKKVGEKLFTCQRCGKKKYKTMYAKHNLNSTNGFTYDSRDSSVGGDVVSPTCENEGYIYAECKTCGSSYKIMKKKPLGHNLVTEDTGSYKHTYCTRKDCTYDNWDLK